VYHFLASGIHFWLYPYQSLRKGTAFKSVQAATFYESEKDLQSSADSPKPRSDETTHLSMSNKKAVMGMLIP
jgi:hypothetical protein